MALQFPGFCGLHFNQPVPSGVKIDFDGWDYEKRVSSYINAGYFSASIKRQYVPIPFMQYDSYHVGLFPTEEVHNLASHFMDDDFLSSNLLIGEVEGYYGGEIKDEYGFGKFNRENEEMVKSLFYKSKNVLDGWLGVEGVETPGVDDGEPWDINICYDYELPNNFIQLSLRIEGENNDEPWSIAGIHVYEKNFYEYCQKYQKLRQVQKS